MSTHEKIVQWIKIALAIFAIGTFIMWSLRVLDLLRMIELNTWTRTEIIKKTWSDIEAMP